MNKEIIINIIKSVANKEENSRNNLMNLSDKDFKTLLDYITNGQEENEKLKERVQIGQNAFLSLNSKIDKAIEYIETNTQNYYVNKPHYRGIELINIEDLLKILKGKEK